MKKLTKDSALGKARRLSKYMNVHREERRVNKRQPLLMIGGALLTGFVVKRLLKGGNSSIRGRMRDNVSDWHRRAEHEAILDRDQPGPVSVSSDRLGHPSYTHNAEKSTPYDPHMMEENPPGRAPAPENTEDNALDRDRPGPLSVFSRLRQKHRKPHSAGQSAHAGERNNADVLDRDQSSPVSVSSDEQGHTSYTHNAEKSTPYDPHMMEENPPGRAPSPKNTEDNALDRDKPGPLSVKGDKSTRWK